MFCGRARPVAPVCRGRRRLGRSRSHAPACADGSETISAVVRYSRVRTEEFTVVGADRPPVRFPTIFCRRSSITGELSVLSSLVSIGAVCQCSCHHEDFSPRSAWPSFFDRPPRHLVISSQEEVDRRLLSAI